MTQNTPDPTPAPLPLREALANAARTLHWASDHFEQLDCDAHMSDCFMRAEEAERALASGAVEIATTFRAFVARVGRLTVPDIEVLSSDGALDEVRALAGLIGEAHELTRAALGPFDASPEAQAARDRNALVQTLNACRLALNGAPSFTFNAGDNALDLKVNGHNRASSYALAKRVDFVLEMVGLK